MFRLFRPAIRTGLAANRHYATDQKHFLNFVPVKSGDGAPNLEQLGNNVGGVGIPRP